jgi:hypothetical protein
MWKKITTISDSKNYISSHKCKYNKPDDFGEAAE